MYVPLDALAELEAVATLGPLNFTTLDVGKLAVVAGTPAAKVDIPSTFDIPTEPRCPYGGKYVGAGVDITG